MHVELATICTSSPIRGRPRLVVRPRSECRNAEQGPRFPANTHSHTHTHTHTHTHILTHMYVYTQTFFFNHSFLIKTINPLYIGTDKSQATASVCNAEIKFYPTQ